MKSSRIAFVTPIFTIGLSAGLVSGAWAADFYVSADKSYGTAEGADADHRFDDLQAAIDAADPEDTVYVKDGFECKTGSSTYDSTDCRIFINKKLTLQGESGDWKTGPIIRGKYADDYKEGDASTRQGAGAVSCVRGTDKTKVLLIGFQLLEGATPGKDKMVLSGGGAYKVSLQNCLVSGCAGRDGGGICGCDTMDCEITDCYGSNTGGGCSGGIHHNALVRGCSSGSHGGGCDDATMYDSVITNCVAAGYGGGARLGTHYDTTFVGCTVAGSNNGGGVYNTTLYRCKFINCNRAAAYHVKAYDCDFTDCPSYSYGSAFMFYGSANIASNCTFRHNGTPAVGSMNSGNGARMIDCVVEDNEGTALACNYNGAVYYVINSYISCTNPANYAVLMNSYQGSGTKLNSVNATNSTFVGAIRGGGDFHNCFFIDGESSVDSMFYCNEKLATYSGKTVPLNLYNCTAIGNTSTFGSVADGGYVNAYNSIIRGNTGKSGTADHFATAQSSCLEDTAVAETEADCIREDPLFITDDGGLPHPSETSPCRASGNLDYVMTETDLAGNPRTSIKDGLMVVAMGACEFDPDLAGAEITCQPTARLAPASGTFTASCSGLGTENLTYYWDFNGDGTIDIVTVDPICSYSYPMPGSYMATLYASNAVKGVSATFPMVILEGYFVSAHDIHEVPGLPGGWGTYTTLDGHEHLAYTNIQQAIDAASAAGGGKVVVSPGTYLCGSIFLKSHVELHLPEGARLVGSSDLDDYNPLDAFPQNYGSVSEGWSARHLILALEQTDVAITGSGAIDGNGKSFFGDKPEVFGDTWWRDGGINARDREHQGRPGQLVEFVECRGVRVEGVRIVDSPCWSVGNGEWDWLHVMCSSSATAFSPSR